MKIKLSEAKDASTKVASKDERGRYKTPTPSKTGKLDLLTKSANNLRLIETKQINNVSVDGWYGTQQAWFTRTQIGQALEYSNPQKAILLIHNRHKERLDLFSLGYQFDTPAGKREGYVYNLKGVLEICRWSRQPKADMVMDALYDMAVEVMEKGYYSALPDDKLLSLLTERTKNNPNMIKEATMSKRNEHWYNQFKIDNKLQELWNKRFDLNPSEYNSELVIICNDYITRYNQEWRKYMRWSASYRKALYNSKLL